MRASTAFVLILAITACGNPADTNAVAADDTSSDDLTICSCMLEVTTTSTRANSCAELIATKTPEEIVEVSAACHSGAMTPGTIPASSRELDLCYCLQATITDPDIFAACEAIIPANITPPEISEKIVECSRR